MLPFTWEAQRDSAGRTHLFIRNAEERIHVDEVVITADSFHARMPLFDSEFVGLLHGDSLISGSWVNHLKGPGYRVPFTAKSGVRDRFMVQCTGGDSRFNGPWATRFSPGTPDAYDAIGIFNQASDGKVQGTFLTETGDYRYLEGAACGDSLLLSGFDGSHAFLFACAIDGDSLHGRFWSGVHWQEPWSAVRDPEYALRDPDSLTALRDGVERIDFRFMDTDGLSHSPSDPEYAAKPLIVHIMGSWCPNCVDETRLLVEMHRKYQAQGLRIIAVAFEKHADEQRALAGLRRFKERLRVPYAVLYGGPAAKDKAAEKLPFLNHLMSYPTCIFIDRSGRVRRIRSGFSGPGTGSHYAAYRAHLDEFLKRLVEER